MGTSVLLLFYLQEFYQTLSVKIREKFLPASIKGGKYALTYAQSILFIKICSQKKLFYQRLTYMGLS